MRKGDVYRHYKGGLYTYIGIATHIQYVPEDKKSYMATHEETEEEVRIAQWALNVYVTMLDHPVVLYKSHKDGKLWARPVDKFFDIGYHDGEYVKRFTLVEPGK